MSESAERKEAPTPRHLAKARAQGQWPHSAIASAWFAMLATALPIWLVKRTASSWISMLHATAHVATTLASQNHLSPLMTQWAESWISWRAGWMLVGSAAVGATLAAFGSATASGALRLTPAALLPRFERLSPRFGAKVFAGSEGLAQAGLVILGCALFTSCAFPALTALEVLTAGQHSLASVPLVIGSAFRGFFLRLFLGMALLAVLDIWRLRASMNRSLRMSVREIREERAQAEVRPEVRSRQRRASVQAARAISIGAIRKATAVVANPEHLAIALRYAPPGIDVPIVVSRGADLAAALVRSIAALHDIPVIESPELARTLYARSAVGEPIPEECFAAVAAIFALLLQTRGILLGHE